MQTLTDDVESRVPPQDLAAEGAVISAILVDPAAFAQVADLLQPHHFFSEAHRRIYEAAVELTAAGTPIDVVTAATWLRDRERLAQAGGVAYLTEILNAAPAVANVRAYGDTVRRKWCSRERILIHQRAVALGYTGVDDTGAVAELTKLSTFSTLDGAAPTAAEPLRGLEHLAKVAIVGASQLRALAGIAPRYVWNHIAVAGTIVLIASGPSEGKTTLLCLVLAARANAGQPVHLLGRHVEPAPAGAWVVLIEGEHSESSAARKLLRSVALLRLDESALDRVILVARKAVRLGSPEWNDVVRLISAGLVSDIAIDTVARVAPSDSDSEREQTAIFDLVAQAIDAAPSEATRPTAWVNAHTRKNGRTGDVSDVAGSVQRTGQADSVLMLEGEKLEGRTVATKVVFAKLREEPDEYPLPVTFAITGDELRTSTVSNEEDGRPIEARIVEQLETGAKTATALATTLRRSTADVQTAISSLFASHRITSTEVSIGGRQRKAFALRKHRTLAPDEQTHRTTPDEHRTDA